MTNLFSPLQSSRQAAFSSTAPWAFPGPALDGKSVYELLRDEKCNFSLGASIIWLAFLQYYRPEPVVP